MEFESMNERPLIILASSSPRRRDLLTQAGIEHIIIPGNADETHPDGTPSPAEIVKTLAKRKAMAVNPPEDLKRACIVLGADTVVAMDGKIYEKPIDEEDAFSILCELRGRMHDVFTGVSMRYFDANGTLLGEKSDVCSTGVYFSDISDKEILSYIKTGEPLDKAGAYAIQGRFAPYIYRIDGDYSNVVGLPLSIVKAMSDSLTSTYYH